MPLPEPEKTSADEFWRVRRRALGTHERLRGGAVRIGWVQSGSIRTGGMDRRDRVSRRRETGRGIYSDDADHAVRFILG